MRSERSKTLAPNEFFLAARGERGVLTLDFRTILPLIFDVREPNSSISPHRGITDPKLKRVIARLEHVNDIPALVNALEQINVSSLADVTDEPETDETS